MGDVVAVLGLNTALKSVALKPTDFMISESHGWGTDDDSSLGKDTGTQASEDNNEVLKTLEREVGPHSHSSPHRKGGVGEGGRWGVVHIGDGGGGGGGCSFFRWGWGRGGGVCSR